MRRIINCLVILIATIITGRNVGAQQIKVVSAADNSPLPFATVTNHTQPLVVSCDRNGLTHLSANIGDTISISYVGYKTTVFAFNGDQIQVVQLLLNQTTLPPITIYNCKNPKEFNYNNFKAVKGVKGDGWPWHFYGVTWTKGNHKNSQIAIRLNPLKPNATLKDFSFWIQKVSEAPGSSIRAPLLISLYEVSDSTNLPGQLISDAPIFYFPKKAGKQTITFDSLQVKIPSNGIFVSLQYVMNQEYEWKWRGKLRNVKQNTIRDTVIINYGGRIQGLRSAGFDYVWYSGVNKEWFSLPREAYGSDNLHPSIKCEVTIKYCNDD